MSLDLERPIRNPDTGSAPLMTKRARWLVVLGFLLPGSAQLLAGNRKLGRFGLTATVTLLVFGVFVLVGMQTAREFTLSVFTNSIAVPSGKMPAASAPIATRACMSARLSSSLAPG